MQATSSVNKKNYLQEEVAVKTIFCSSGMVETGGCDIFLTVVLQSWLCDIEEQKRAIFFKVNPIELSGTLLRKPD